MSTDRIIFRSMIFQSPSIFSANILHHLHMLGAYQVALVVRTCLPLHVYIRDTSMISGQEYPLEEGMANHSSILSGESHR